MRLTQFEIRHSDSTLGEAPVPNFHHYLAQMRVEGMSWSAEVDGLVVASAGLVPLWAGVAEAWMISGDEVDRHAIKIARTLRTMLEDTMWQRSIHRAQANIHSRFERALRLAEWLGFENEGLMRRFGVEGDDYFRFAKVIDSASPSFR